MLRTCYRAKMRLWAGSEEETEVYWFRTLPGAVPIEDRNQFGSQVWRTEKGPADIGEQPSRRLDYYRGTNYLGYLGRNRCGAGDVLFTGGIPDVTPAIVTDAEGASTCCVMPQQVARGGAFAGGRATQPWSAGGGAVVGGAAIFRINGQQAQGGAMVGGEAIQGIANGLAGQGGAIAGGEARQLLARFLAGVGGVIAGGAAGQGLLNSVRGVGGAEVGGIATQGLANRLEARGGSQPQDGAFQGGGLYFVGSGGAEAGNPYPVTPTMGFVVGLDATAETPPVTPTMGFVVGIEMEEEYAFDVARSFAFVFALSADDLYVHDIGHGGD